MVYDRGADVCSHVEPILMEGSAEFRILKDKWTAVTADDKRFVLDKHKCLVFSQTKWILMRHQVKAHITTHSCFYMTVCVWILTE